MNERYKADLAMHDEFMSSVLQQNAQSPSARARSNQGSRFRRIISRKSSSGHTPRHTGMVADEASYQRALFGRPRAKSTSSKPNQVNLQISINLKKPSFKFITNFASHHKKSLVRTGVVSMVIVIGIAGFNFLAGRNQKAPEVAGATILAPKTVFLPQPVPEGFTVASGSQELDNGAMLYGVYAPDGQLITITQQSEPADFQDDFFKNVPQFNTPYGSGYIISDVERTTGYLLADDSWVLLNASADTPGEDLRTLIKSLQPSS